jgi:hypothetical protein
MVDATGDVVTASCPDRTLAAARRSRPIIEGSSNGPSRRATRTLDGHILELLHAPYSTADDFEDAFLRPYLYSQAYDRGFGTLYTAAYRPGEGRARYRWPSFSWELSFDAFEEGSHEETLAEGSVA